MFGQQERFQRGTMLAAADFTLILDTPHTNRSGVKPKRVTRGRQVNRRCRQSCVRQRKSSAKRRRWLKRFSQDYTHTSTSVVSNIYNVVSLISLNIESRCPRLCEINDLSTLSTSHQHQLSIWSFQIQVKKIVEAPTPTHSPRCAQVRVNLDRHWFTSLELPGLLMAQKMPYMAFSGHLGMYGGPLRSFRTHENTPTHSPGCAPVRVNLDRHWFTSLELPGLLMAQKMPYMAFSGHSGK